MKAKFGLFCIDRHDPAGGLDDMLVTFNDISEVITYVDNNHHKLKGSILEGFWEVVDFRSLERHQIDAQNLISSIQNKIED